MNKIKLVIACGGPSAERGISLNSARSLYDNLDNKKYEISLVYYNPDLTPYLINPAQIYSNTPLDFDYKLNHEGNPLNNESLKKLFTDADLVFPAIHGIYGEDGQLQTYLEQIGAKYIGSGPKACQNTSNKNACQRILKNHGFYTVEGHVIKKGESLPSLENGKYVVKPLHGGSSIGVEYFRIPEDIGELLDKKIEHVFSVEDQALIEPFFEGTEFTVIVLENQKREAVALYPTEIEFSKHSSDKFFNYRKKYLATDDVRYHTPSRFGTETNEKIRTHAEKAFKSLEMRDFARLDGWIKDSGEIWFSDINAISGMEQNSFLFQQAALFGISHRQLLDYIINKKINPPDNSENKEEIPVIFGGKTAERQVSVMSGTNVWMKLKSSQKYKPVPLFQSTNDKIYHVPQFLCLHHTVEEIEEKIEKFQDVNFYNNLRLMQTNIFNRLNINPDYIEEQIFIPYETTLEEISHKYGFLFLGLHGGDGENGELQSKLEALKLPFNGPGSVSSAICMDKYATGELIEKNALPGIRTAKKISLPLHDSAETLWNKILEHKLTPPLILKPRNDGCSAGVIRIDTKEQFLKTYSYLSEDHRHIPEKAIHDFHPQIELPKEKLTEILVEEFILTDKVNLKHLEIDWQTKTDIIEVTVGVIGEKGNMKAFFPSQTIANQEILSLEEKFMGGTGINLTPPPKQHVNSEAVRGVMNRVKQVADLLQIEGYSRIDTFMNRNTGEITVIEANTLPGMTPSTVIFHQALAEPNPMTPLQFIEKIIEIGKDRYKKTISDDRKPAGIIKTPAIESFEESRI